MHKDVDVRGAKYHRVIFFKDGRETSIVFPGYVLACNFLSTLHSCRKGRIVPAPELESIVLEPPAPDRPAGTIVQCPRGPRIRTWKARRPRLMRRYPDFSRNVMNMPKQSSGFSLTFPEQPATVVTVVARHSSIEEAIEWCQNRYGETADGEWWPKEEKKSAKK